MTSADNFLPPRGGEFFQYIDPCMDVDMDVDVDVDRDMDMDMDRDTNKKINRFIASKLRC